MKCKHLLFKDWLKAELTTLQSITTNLASKIKDLCTQNSTLQEQLQVVSSDLANKSIPSPSDSEPLPSIFDEADEIAECNWWKKNVIVYNLPEQTNRAADKVKFIEVCKSISDEKIDIEKLFRLGRKNR